MQKAPVTSPSPCAALPQQTRALAGLVTAAGGPQESGLQAARCPRATPAHLWGASEGWKVGKGGTQGTTEGTSNYLGINLDGSKHVSPWGFAPG